MNHLTNEKGNQTDSLLKIKTKYKVPCKKDVIRKIENSREQTLSKLQLGRYICFHYRSYYNFIDKLASEAVF